MFTNKLTKNGATQDNSQSSTRKDESKTPYEYGELTTAYPRFSAHTFSESDMSRLQKMIGNQAVTQLVSRNNPNHGFEEEESTLDCLNTDIEESPTSRGSNSIEVDRHNDLFDLHLGSKVLFTADHPYIRAHENFARPIRQNPSRVTPMIQRWSTQHEEMMVRLHSGTLHAAMIAYRNAIENSEPHGANVEATKQVVREKLTIHIQRLLMAENIGDLDGLQRTVNLIGDPTGLLRRMFRHRVRQYLRQMLSHADARTRKRLRSTFGALGQGNWLGDVFVTYLDSTPILDENESSHEFFELVGVLSQSQTEPARQEAVRNLTQWFRNNAVEVDQVRAFLGGGHSATYKTHVLGRIAVQFARGEFLLGWAYEGGYQQNGAWEEFGPSQGHPAGTFRNAGEYPTTYQAAVRTWGSDPAYLPPGQQPTAGNYAEWCTSFVGFLMRHLGFQAREVVGEGTRHSMFWSGTRLRRWASTGQSSGGTMLSDPNNLFADQPSSVLMEQETFRRLRVHLNGTAVADRVRVVQEFFDAEGHGLPQSGDVILHPEHTMMIESYDHASATIATIEGNRGQAVRSRNLVLSDPTTVAQIRALIRIGSENFQGFGREIENAPEVEGEGLVARITDYVGLLADRLERLGYISAGAGASTQSWQAGIGGGGEH